MSQEQVEQPQQQSQSVDNNSEYACVVCFKNIEIFSIGSCDHPFCHECSTRMRVLCKQNECPICRQSLSKVIFTNDNKPYRELERQHRSPYYSKQYKIAFMTNQIQQAYFELLSNPCPKCDVQPFAKFESLRDHVRREHEHFYCDLCVANLKFSLSSEGATIDNNWEYIDGSVMPITLPIEAILCVNIVMLDIWTEMNCFGICEESTSFVISVMLKEQISFTAFQTLFSSFGSEDFKPNSGYNLAICPGAVQSLPEKSKRF
uniref:RING-type domain-containing protein n=1 Tax=Megaselia scalaris TaxID=36166 RepID=T1H0H0_MEGSC